MSQKQTHISPNAYKPKRKIEHRHSQYGQKYSQSRVSKKTIAKHHLELRGCVCVVWFESLDPGWVVAEGSIKKGWVSSACVLMLLLVLITRNTKNTLHIRYDINEHKRDLGGPNFFLKRMRSINIKGRASFHGHRRTTAAHSTLQCPHHGA